MAKNDTVAMVGKYSFIIGIFLAIIAGIIPSIANFTYVLLVLVALGLIVGFLNIAQKNITTLLLGIIALSIIGGATVNAVPSINVYLEDILNNFLAFVGAAGFVVALKAIFQVTKA